MPLIIEKLQQLPLILEDAENNLTPLSRELFAEHDERLVVLNEEIEKQDQRISHLCQTNELSQRFIEVGSW